MRSIVSVLGAAALLLAACSGGSDADDASGVREGDAESPTEVLGDADEGIEGVQALRVFYESPVHATGAIDYGLDPPAGGLHNPAPLPCDHYDQPVPNENAGHTLEHGGVVISFAPDLPEADLEVIRQLVAANPSVLAAPYPGLDADEPVVASAWARQLRLDAVTDPRLAEFVAQYQGGSQAPEANVGC